MIDYFINMRILFRLKIVIVVLLFLIILVNVFQFYMISRATDEGHQILEDSLYASRLLYEMSLSYRHIHENIVEPGSNHPEIQRHLTVIADNAATYLAFYDDPL